MDVRGPRVRLGLAWAAISAAAVALGGVVCALVMAAVALGAAGQASKSWRKAPSRSRPNKPVAVAGAFLLPVAVTGGSAAVAATALLVGVGSVLATWLQSTDLRATAAVGLLVGAGAASVVVVRDELGPAPALVLLACAHVYDASAFVIGSGTTSRLEGPVAGIVSIAVVCLLAAAVLVPPFRGPSPLVLFVTASVLAPAGTYLASAILGDQQADVPALRRIDSLLLLGPVWGAIGALTLDVVR